MKGSEARLIDFMDGNKKRFIIPVYQRCYSWKIEQCKQLFDDLVAMIKNNRKTHFFGSIVSLYNPNGRNTEYLIIDGQQRLTTVSLLLLAVYNLLHNNKIHSNEEGLGQEIYEECLIDKHQPTQMRLKLKPIQSDAEAYRLLFDAPDNLQFGSNITINYNYFYSRIQKEEVSVDELYDAVCSLMIINIELNSEDDPQLIFESLNSTGLDLSEGDKIRNFILMGLSAKDQEINFKKYWEPIESDAGQNVGAFIRDYLSLKTQSIPPQQRVYSIFKSYVLDNYQQNGHVKTEDLLKELRKYAQFYQILLSASSSDKELNACIYRLNHLETTVTRPFFLEVLRMLNDNQISINDVRQIFLITENYLFRRNICELPTNALNKIYMSLHREIERLDDQSSYLERYKYILLNKKERARFPGNQEFQDKLGTRAIYDMNSKNKIYILERFENRNREDKDIYHHFIDGEYSIEHIMPQTLTPEWRKMLGEHADSIHVEWKDRLANLTLTAYNSQYQNASFEKKRDQRNGYRDSGIRLNKWIAEQDKWNEIELKARNTKLLDEALEIWPMPITSFIPEKRVFDEYSLDDDESIFTGRTIVKYRFKSEHEVIVKNWIDMMESLVKTLHEIDRTVLYQLAQHHDDDSELALWVSSTPDGFRKAMQIDTSIYVERNNSTIAKIRILRKLFVLYHESPTDLVFCLSDDNAEPESENTEPERYELRRNFWAYALPIIRTYCNNQLFNNVNPSKENWVNGAIGISGVYISCVANYDSAMVKLIFSKSNSDLNKSLFDVVYKQKQLIELKLGELLQWDRGDNKKQSQIFIQLSQVKLQDESNWKLMAKFLGEWSNRFINTLVPFVTRK